MSEVSFVILELVKVACILQEFFVLCIFFGENGLFSKSFQ